MLTGQYTYSTWFFDQQVVYTAAQDGSGCWVLTWEVLGAGVIVLGNYKTLALAQAAIKNDEQQGL
jgi:hypothetical protein